MTSRKFKLQNYYPPEIFLSWCIRAVGNFYSIKCSLRKKTRLPLDAERLSCLYIQRCACMDVICKESCIWKICALAPKFLVFFWLTLSKKIDSPRKQYTSFDVKMLLLTGKIGKAYEGRNSFCLHGRRNFRLLKPGAQPKLAHAFCVFPLSMQCGPDLQRARAWPGGNVASSCVT